MNSVSVSFANGGFVITTVDQENDVVKTEVTTSPGKAIKAVRSAFEEFSLLPKKSGAEESDE